MQEKVDLEKVAQIVCDQMNCQLLDKVGSGGFKETFHIRDISGTDLALKIYQSGLSPRSIREINVMERLDHPGIAKLIDTGEIEVEDTHFFYILEEFLGGGTLTDALKKNGLFTREKTIEFGRYLIHAIAFLETQNLVHRDIKPDNILFRENSDIPILTDFGIVRDLEADSFTPTWVDSGPGTRGFASPEQMNNEKHLENWRSDQFSLGIVLALCSLGIHPYDHGNQTAQYIAQKGAFYPDFKRIALEKGFPVIINMVDPWPAKRYKTPDELLRAWNSQ